MPPVHSSASICAISIGLAGALLASSAFAQSPPDAKPTLQVGDFQLTPLLELRTRGEYRRSPVDLGGSSQRGASGPVVDDAWGIFERSRLGLGAEHGILRAQVTFQDARAWGQQPPFGFIAGGSGFAAFGAYETFFEIRTAPVSTTDPTPSDRPNPPRRTYFRVGRQAVTWGDGRLLGNADWSPSARTLDAARLHVSTSKVDLELLAAILDSSRPVGAAFDDVSGPYSSGAQLYGALVGWTIDPLLKLEAYGLTRLQGSNPYVVDSDFALARATGETYTGTLRVSGDSKVFEYSAAGYLQAGRASSLSPDRQTRLAYAFAADVGGTSDAIVLSPKLTAGASMASGDDGSGNYRAFDPLLPDVHVHYGAMNVFSLSNMMEAHGGLVLTPSQETRVGAEYRYARLVNATGEWLNGYLFSVGRAARDNQSYDLGHEIDVFFHWRPLPQIDLRAGYSLLLLGDGAKAILQNPTQARGTRQPDGTFQAADFSHYGYLNATIRIP